MKLPRKFLRFDYGVHILFGVLLVFSIVMAPLSYGTSLIAFLYCCPPLWIWQVFSALVLSLGYQNKIRTYYLLATATIGAACLLFESSLMGEYIVFLWFPLAAWYAYLTYKDATYRTPSFWDLEF